MKTIAEMFEGAAHNLVWKNRFNEIIDMVYNKYDELFDSYYPPFSAPYPKRLTKEELVEEIKNGGKVVQEYELGVKIWERELSLDERLCIADNFNPLIREDCLTKTHHPDETDELKLQYRHEWLDSLGPNVVPQRKVITIEYKNETITVYE
jgi:hypothetical protein